MNGAYIITVVRGGAAPRVVGLCRTPEAAQRHIELIKHTLIGKWVHRCDNQGWWESVGGNTHFNYSLYSFVGD